MNKPPNDDTVPDPPLPDILPLNDTPGCPPEKPKRKQNNTTSVGIDLGLIMPISKLINQQTKLLEWLAFRQSCLEELLHHDGHGDFLGHKCCSSCGKGDGVYKCKDCFSGGLLCCQECLVTAHRDHPLHRIEVCAYTLCPSFLL